jgi:multiple sugar transport system ATP-binding protein
VAGGSVIATAPGKFIPEAGATLSCITARGNLYLFDAGTEQSLGRL